MPRKKKISSRVKGYNIALIGVLSVLIITLVVVLATILIKSRPIYKIENRSKQIENNKKNDNENYKTKGWVRVQGTNIDYPLYRFNKEVLDMPVNKSLLWDLSFDNKFHSVMHVYGHNIKNLSSKPLREDEGFTRLEELMSYVYYDFAEDNKYFQITIGNKDYLYKIFAVNFMDTEQFYGYSRSTFKKKNDKKDYIDTLLEESIYDYDIDVDVNDDIASVVTCTRFFGPKSSNFLVTGRLMRNNEKADNYKVHRNKNYVEKIKPLLEGEEVEDEE